MAEDVKTTEEVLEDEDLEKSFNEAVEEWDKLNKSDSDPDPDPEPEPDDSDEGDADKGLEKAAKKKKFPPKKKEVDREPEDEDEEEDEEGVKKSIEDQLEGDAEAEAAMDVEPWLREFAKSIDKAFKTLTQVHKSRIEKLEKLVKAQGNMLKAQVQLQKSNSDMLEKIGKTEIPSGSIMSLQKARFENKDADPTEIDGADLLNKGQEWLLKGHIDILESTKLVNRVNKGLVGKYGDALDQKVKKLLKEEG